MRMITKKIPFTFLLMLSFFSLVIRANFPAYAAQNGVERHGRLSVRGGRLVDKKGEAVQLRGMSSHGLTWYPLYINPRSLRSLKARGANLFRAAMYTYTQGENMGYNHNETARLYNKAMLYLAVENALAADMYVIADWHVLEEKNPLYHMESAAAFFDELSARYAGEPGVLYEICNEPNGETTWAEIKIYAKTIVPIIRKNSPRAVILIGTPNYSMDLFSAIRAPLPFDNIMYTFHFYAGMRERFFDTVLKKALEAGVPVFVSEWGISRDEKSGQLNIDEAMDFIAYAKREKISWANWSLSNKPEDYSAIRSDVDKLSDWSDDDLSPSGKVIFNAFKD